MTIELVPAGSEAEETPNPRNIYDPITKNVRTWEDVEETRDCPLCQVIKYAVEDTRTSWLSPSGPHSCELMLKRLHGWYSADRMHFGVRYLEVTAKFDWNTSHGIELLPVESEEYPGYFPGCLVDPQGIDVGRVRSWLSGCQNEHRDLCRHLESPQFRKIREHILVFEVEQQCLVYLPVDGRYFALSYVQGNVQSLRTLRGHVQSFMTQNGLLSINDQLPKVILDAARLTAQLGERYPWVDALCIVRNNTASKDLLICAMNTIYESAFLIIFAVTGTDSNAGLPGVRPTQRGRSAYC
ncbi:hypothetical protein RRF57_001643 [Xylaria bambusicola]|uniref:Heterokaryon incompatibility domain-containing protein n=1 Tax=Xylaria bambusicola TaxID=326684 RepID=A0AAN7Z1S1_9PEZI